MAERRAGVDLPNHRRLVGDHPAGHPFVNRKMSVAQFGCVRDRRERDDYIMRAALIWQRGKTNFKWKYAARFFAEDCKNVVARFAPIDAEKDIVELAKTMAFGRRAFVPQYAFGCNLRFY